METKMQKLVVKNTKDFSIKQILDCGQIFRYYLLTDKLAVVISSEKLAVVKENVNNVEIFAKDIKYFEQYFDLQTDYNKIKKELSKDKFLKPCCESCYGIRILKQDFFEMLISFMISANNKKVSKFIVKKIW